MSRLCTQDNVQNVVIYGLLKLSQNVSFYSEHSGPENYSATEVPIFRSSDSRPVKKSLKTIRNLFLIIERTLEN